MRYALPQHSLASVIGLGILAVGSSILLMPRGREMALLQFHTGNRQLGLAMLEERVFNDDRSPATIAALAQARAESGNIEGAARLLEDMMGRDGDNLAALTMLEGFERTVSRTAQLIGTLESLQRLAPTIQRQREIASLYAAAGRTDDRLRTVRDLVRLFPAEPVEFVLLAQLERAAGHPREAELALQALAAAHPDAVDASTVGLEISLLLPEGQADQALTRARLWLQGRSDLATSAPMLAGAFSFGNRPDLAVALLEPIAAQSAQPGIAAALAQAHSDSGHPAAGLQLLERLDADGATPAGQEAALLRLRLALAVQGIDRAVAAADRIGLAQIPPDVLMPFAQLALNGHREDVLRTILAAAGPDFFTADPVTGARVSLALGDKEAAQRWSSLALGTVDGHPDRAIQLAAVELGLGHADAAAGLLGRALSDPALPSAWLRDVANLYVRAQQADAGRLALEKLRRVRPGLPADIAWAITAAAAGHGGEVVAWMSAPNRPALSADVLQDLFYVANDAHAADLAVAAARQLVATRGSVDDKLLLTRMLLAAGQPGQAFDLLRTMPDQAAVPADVLQDLFYVANDAHAADLALTAARQLVATRGAAADKLLLARALLAADQPEQALGLLRTISDPSAVPEDLRAAVLFAAWRHKAPVAAELRTVWVARLAAAKTTQERDAAISLLLELRAYAELLPTLRTLVEQDPEHWLWSFAQATKATGRKADLVAVWARLSERPGTPALLRRQLAFSLLEAGNKAAAERAFRILAASAPTTSPDMRELLFIWGPRPTAAQLDWIETRAQQAGRADKAAWMSILASHGAPARAIGVYRASPGEQTAAMKQVYIAALSAIGNRAALAAAIRDELPRATTAADLQQLAQLCERSGDLALEQLVVQKLVATGGASPAVFRRLGVLAYQARDMAAAERYLLMFTSAAGGDYETRMLLGDLATRRRDAAGARQHYAASLALLQNARDQSSRANTVRANLLHRLGRDDEAAKLYEALLVAHPQDKNLRADYVAMLMEQGSLRRAQAVLAMQ